MIPKNVLFDLQKNLYINSKYILYITSKNMLQFDSAYILYVKVPLNLFRCFKKRGGEICSLESQLQKVHYFLPIFYKKIKAIILVALRASRLRSFGPALGPSGLLDNVHHALRALRPCDPRNSAMMGQCVRDFFVVDCFQIVFIFFIIFFYFVVVDFCFRFFLNLVSFILVSVFVDFFLV